MPSPPALGEEVNVSINILYYHLITKRNVDHLSWNINSLTTNQVCTRTH